jgi:hypothetical protein
LVTIDRITHDLGVHSDGTGRSDELDWLASEVLGRIGIPQKEASGERLREELLARQGRGRRRR